MHILNRAEIERLIDFDQAAQAIEQAYRDYSGGRVNQPPVGHIAFAEYGGDCHIKYGQVRDDDAFVVKIAVGAPRNAERGLPTGNGLSIVLSAETGAVRAVLHDEMLMTDVRTALGGAIATRLLAPSAAKRLLVIGTGVQARHQIEAHARLLGEEIAISIWGRSRQRAERVVHDLRGVVDVALCDDLAEACSNADIIVTVTGATQPVVRTDWVTAGTHITAVGADAPGKQELETAIVESADVRVADSVSQCLDHGEFEAAARERLSVEQVVELGEILNGQKPGRKTAQELTVADLTGLAVQDIAIAKHVLARKSAGRT